jgi:hypothetical protein
MVFFWFRLFWVFQFFRTQDKSGMESPSLSGSEIAKRVHTLLPSELRFHDLSHVLQTNAWAEGKYFTASLEPFARSNRLLFEAMQASALETANHCDVTRDYMDGSRDYVEDLYRESKAFRGTWGTCA